MSDLPFGIDISRWNSNSELTQHPDFDTMVRGGVRFVAMRAGISWGYKDPTFDRNWGEASRVRMPRIAYHVPYFHQSIENQVDHFLRIVEGAGVNWKNDRLALDLEVDGGQPRAKITYVTCGMMERLKSATGRYPILYSRASWVDTFMAMNDLLADADWWLAQYYKANPSPQYTPEYPSPPRLPKGINHWLIHQTAEKGNGGAVGVVSHYVDCNRWNGTMEQMRAWFGLGEEEPEPEPPEVPETKLFDARVYSWATPFVNIRKEPDIQSEDLGDLYPNTTVPVYEITGEWYGIAHGGVRGYAMSKYLQRLDYQPPLVGEFAYFSPIYNQRDVRWKDHPLGTKSTIGQNGCLMTCAAMVCNHFGHATNPLALNRWLTENGGYLDGNLFLWAKVEELYPDMKFGGFVYSPSTAQIRAAIQSGTLPIMFVDFNDDTPLIEMHWVLGIGVTGSDVLIADPWTGTIGRLSEMYPKRVIRCGSYQRRA